MQCGFSGNQCNAMQSEPLQCTHCCSGTISLVNIQEVMRAAAAASGQGEANIWSHFFKQLIIMMVKMTVIVMMMIVMTVMVMTMIVMTVIVMMVMVMMMMKIKKKKGRKKNCCAV